MQDAVVGKHHFYEHQNKPRFNRVYQELCNELMQTEPQRWKRDDYILLSVYSDTKLMTAANNDTEKDFGSGLKQFF